MPHTSRRRVQTHRKRTQVHDSDGWTHIATSRHHQDWSKTSPRIPLGPAETPEGLTTEKLQEEYSRHKRIWAASDCCKALNTILTQQTLVKGEGDAEWELRIDKCICLGLGSLVDPVSRRYSMFQLGALQSILEVLNTRVNISSIYAQDPVFNDLDKELLGSLNITVIEDPQVFSRIDQSTFVYAPHCERSFLLPGLAGKNPALMVGNDMAHMITGSLSSSLTAAELQIGRDFVQDRTTTAFPAFEAAENAFNNTTIYWRSSPED
ncbi:MAG: hypothetical protein M1827_004765 [Pycnora praestabilis]|nr:MAG: hypothetical protein M1827_004765 [Pycnora praestabilis]